VHFRKNAPFHFSFSTRRGTPPRQQRLRDYQIEGLDGLEVDHELELRRLLDRKVGRLWRT